MDEIIENELNTHIQVLKHTFAQGALLIEQLVRIFYQCFNSGHKLLLYGNGGRAPDAQLLQQSPSTNSSLTALPFPPWR